MAGNGKKWVKRLALGMPAVGAVALSVVMPQAGVRQILMLFILLWFNISLIVDLA
jgi:hypothetical protein